MYLSTNIHMCIYIYVYHRWTTFGTLANLEARAALEFWATLAGGWGRGARFPLRAPLHLPCQGAAPHTCHAMYSLNARIKSTPLQNRQINV